MALSFWLLWPGALLPAASTANTASGFIQIVEDWGYLASVKHWLGRTLPQHAVKFSSLVWKLASSISHQANAERWLRMMPSLGIKKANHTTHRHWPSHQTAHRSPTKPACPTNSPVTPCCPQKPRAVTGCWQGKCLPRNSGVLHRAWNWDSSDLTSTIKSSLKFNGQSIINPILTISACKPGHR